MNNYNQQEIMVLFYLQVKYKNMAAHSMLYYYEVKTQWLLYHKFTKAWINMRYDEAHMF